MNKVKKSLLLVLSVVLLFGIITMKPFADVTIPQGPIDSVDKDNGVNQIMAAGIKDKNFATAIYDSFAKANYFGESTQDVREILSNYTGTIDASNRGIKEIDGIMWLRKTNKIDLRNKGDFLGVRNEIRNLLPLSVEYIAAEANISRGDARYWFLGSDVDIDHCNTTLLLTGNPIETYALLGGGLIINASTGGELCTIPGDTVSAIKKGLKENWAIKKAVDLPKLTKDGNEVFFDQNPEYGGTAIIRNLTTINSNAYINFEEIKNRKLMIENIKQSGILHAAVSTRGEENSITCYERTFTSGEPMHLEQTVTFGYDANFTARVYYPIVTKKIASTTVKVTKYATCLEGGKIVPGAKYQLFDKTTNTAIAGKEYTTDVNGEFIIEGLTPGEYYLKETYAPEGFLINENTISFAIEEDKHVIKASGGEEKENMHINAGDYQVEENTVYVDRYSNNAMITVDDGNIYQGDEARFEIKGYQLEYFDRTQQKFINGPVLNSPQEITDWINANKGNESVVGAIDGEVRISMIVEKNKELKTSDPRPTTNVTFDKVGKELDTDGQVAEVQLPGATFKLECTHKHTKACGTVENGYKYCTDPHTDCLKTSSDGKCTWTTEVSSDASGKVLFENINTGIYKMTEIKAPEGYLPTKITWTVEVDAAEKTFDIKVDNKKHARSLKGNASTGYTIMNETFNVRVCKIDADEKEKPLPGAKFQLFKEIDGKWVPYKNEESSIVTTDDEGIGYYKKLEVGTYKIKEVEAPAGYEITDNEIKFDVPFKMISEDIDGIKSEITSDNNLVTFTVSNKKGILLPNTGATITARIASIGIVIMGAMVLVYKKIKKENNNHV